MADPGMARAALVAGYVADDGEVDVGSVLEHFRARGARVLLPRLGERGLELVAAEPGSPLPASARTGVPEPTGPALPLDLLPPAGVVLAPCVAVDRAGVRLGRGGGHYDRLLPHLRALGWCSVAVCHDDHLLDRLPSEPHDFRVDRILTEAGWRDLAPRPALHSTAGIVLAGGRSARFGRAKAGVEAGGVPMLRRVVAVLGACCDEVVLVSAPVGSGVDDALDGALAGAAGVPLRRLHDDRAHAGPAAALAGALPRIDADLAFVSGCDSPLLSAALVRGLLSLADRGEAFDLVAADLGRGLEPLVAVYRVETMAARLRAATESGPVRLVDALAGARVRRVAGGELDVLDPTGASFLNVNRPADLEEVERRLAATATPGAQLNAGAGRRSST
jgi:5-formyltetrahydrofolate cyclo-ligase